MTRAEFWNGIIADHAAGQAAAAPPADTHRGWKIYQGRWPEPAWLATSPNYDAWIDSDDWVDNGEKATGATREELLAEIDIWFEENAPPTLREIIAAEISVGDRYATADRIITALTKAEILP